MALSKALEDKLTCPIDLEFYVEPMSLRCRHNLCKKDVDYMISSDGLLECPQCNKVSKRRDIKPDFRTQTLLDLHTPDKHRLNHKQCEHCGDEAASSWCEQCQSYLGKRCKGRKTCNQKTSRKHKLITIARSRQKLPETTLIQMDNISKQVNALVRNLSANISSLNSTLKGNCEEIKASEDRVITVVHRIHDELRRAVQQGIADRKHVVNGAIRDWQAEQVDFNKDIALLHDSMDKSNTNNPLDKEHIANLTEKSITRTQTLANALQNLKMPDLNIGKLYGENNKRLDEIQSIYRTLKYDILKRIELQNVDEQESESDSSVAEAESSEDTCRDVLLSKQTTNPSKQAWISEENRSLKEASVGEEESSEDTSHDSLLSQQTINPSNMTPSSSVNLSLNDSIVVEAESRICDEDMCHDIVLLQQTINKSRSVTISDKNLSTKDSNIGETESSEKIPHDILLSQQTINPSKPTTISNKTPLLGDFTKRSVKTRILQYTQSCQSEVTHVVSINGSIWLLMSDDTINIMTLCGDDTLALEKSFSIYHRGEKYEIHKVIQALGIKVVANCFVPCHREFKGIIVGKIQFEIDDTGAVKSVIAENNYVDLAADDYFVYGLGSSCGRSHVDIHACHNSSWYSVKTVQLSTRFHSLTVHDQVITVCALYVLYEWEGRTRCKVGMNPKRYDLRTNQEFEVDCFAASKHALMSDTKGNVLMGHNKLCVLFRNNTHTLLNIKMDKNDFVLSATMDENGSLLVLLSNGKLLLLTK